VADGERKSSGFLISIILIVGIGGAVLVGWWWWERTKLPFDRMPVATPVKVALLASEGDGHYLSGMRHLMNSDPSNNPEWLAETRKALEFFTKSRDSYARAMDECTGGQAVPPPLLDRVREATMQLYFCRKRIVSFRRQ